MIYRGYTIVPAQTAEPSYNIHDKDGCLIDSAPSHVEAEKVIDGWQNAP